MKRFLALVSICMLLAVGARGQRVGVVLSGGGAKGLYHVGILKALEENNIPIDYVSGASMGAIVAGMYAAGYSPDEMIRFFITDTVQHWLSAKSSDLDNNYYFKKFEPTPTMITVKIDPKAVKSSAIQLPTNIISRCISDGMTGEIVVADAGMSHNIVKYQAAIEQYPETLEEEA